MRDGDESRLGSPRLCEAHCRKGRKGDGLTLESCRRVRRRVVRGGVVVRFRFEGLEVVEVRRMRGTKPVRGDSLRCQKNSAGTAEALAVSLRGGMISAPENCFHRISREASHREGRRVELGKRRRRGAMGSPVEWTAKNASRTFSASLACATRVRGKNYQG